MKYFFVSEDSGETHIITAKTLDNARAIAKPLKVSEIYELTETTFQTEGFLISDLRKRK